MKPLLFAILCLTARADDALLDRIRKVETGGNNHAIGRHGERGAWQISRAAWSDVSRERRRVGLSVYPFTDAFREDRAREYAAGYVALIRGRLGVDCTDAQLCIAWNRGVRRARESGFRREEQPRATRRFL